MSTYTSDTFFNGRIQVKQYRSGYRFSIDSVLLSGLIHPQKSDVVLDLGTGCGIIPLILAYRYPDIRIYGVEVQPALSKIASLNVNENHLGHRITILCQDILTLKKDQIPKPVDMVVCNPPYRKITSGRINSNKQRAVARHELMVTLIDILETTRRILNTSGRFITVYPATRMAEVLSQMHTSGIEPKFLRTIHSYENSEATLIMVEGIQGGRSGMIIGPPLIIYRSDGQYTDEVEKMFV